MSSVTKVTTYYCKTCSVFFEFVSEDTCIKSYNIDTGKAQFGDLNVSVSDAIQAIERCAITPITQCGATIHYSTSSGELPTIKCTRVYPFAHDHEMDRRTLFMQLLAEEAFHKQGPVSGLLYHQDTKTCKIRTMTLLPRVHQGSTGS